MKTVILLVLEFFLGFAAGNFVGYESGVNDVALPAYELGYADARLTCSNNEGKEE